MARKSGEENAVGAEVIAAAPGYLEDYVTGKQVLDKPEERVRQVYLRRLVEEYGYPKSHIATEFPVKKGSKLIGPVDIAVFAGDVHDQSHIYIIVENKREDVTEGLDQLLSYMSPTRASFGVWFNGASTEYRSSHDEAPFFRQIPDIPKYGQTLDDVGRYKKSDLEPATELRSVFESVHNYIYANQGLLKDATFKEILKLLFLKLVDEKSSKQQCDFSITNTELAEVTEGRGESFVERITRVFDRVKHEYRDVFDASETLQLKPDCLAYAVSALQRFSLTRTEADVKGTAFQTFVGAYQRVDRGEFFTPSSVLRLAVQFLNPKDDEFFIDPACGSGGFLVETLRHVVATVERERPDMTDGERKDAVLRYARTYIRGIDFNPDLAKVAKMYMVLYDDGHTGIISEDSLSPISDLKSSSSAAGAGNFDSGMFDLVITNPPFGTKGKITSTERLSNFTLGRNWVKGDDGRYEPTQKLRKGGQTPEILFVERCVELLKPGGRIALVLPDGILTNSSLRYVRDYILNELHVIAVVSLPDGTFRQSGVNPKTSIVFGIRKGGQFKGTTEVFMCELDKLGYDLVKKTAPITYKRDEAGEVLRDEHGLPIIDSEVPDAVEAFRSFKRDQGLSF